MLTVAGVALEEWRKRHGWTRDDLAQAVKCRGHSIFRLERMGTPPLLRIAIAIEDVTGIPVRDWLREAKS